MLKPQFNRGTWNLDWLIPRDGLKLKGEIRTLGLPGPIVSAALFGDGSLATLRPGGMFGRYSPETGVSEAWYFEACRDPVDVVTGHHDIYVLDRSGPEILRVEAPADPHAQPRKTRWPIPMPMLPDHTRLVVTRVPDSSGRVRAHLVLSSARRIVSIDLQPNGSAAQENAIDLPKLASNTSAKKTRPEFHACADPVAGTLLLSDSANHQILEVQPDSGRIDVLAGTTRPGWAGEGCESKRAPLNRPGALAVYRPRSVIPEATLSETSRKVLTADSTGVLPRTVIFAETGSRCVRKLVQLPRSSWLLEASGADRLFTLTGSGNAGAGAWPGPGDLRRLAISGEVTSVSISGRGELLVVTSSLEFTLLRPGTSMLEADWHLDARRRDLYPS